MWLDGWRDKKADREVDEVEEWKKRAGESESVKERWWGGGGGRGEKPRPLGKANTAYRCSLLHSLSLFSQFPFFSLLFSRLTCCLVLFHLWSLSFFCQILIPLPFSVILTCSPLCLSPPHPPPEEKQCGPVEKWSEGQTCSLCQTHTQTFTSSSEGQRGEVIKNHTSMQGQVSNLIITSNISVNWSFAGKQTGKQKVTN